MSVEQQVDRVVAGAKNTLKLLIQKLGGTVPDDTGIDGYADIVSGMTLDKMTPKAHKDTHKTGGSDALTPADIGALAEADIAEYTETEIETLWNAVKLLISFTIEDINEFGVYPTGTFSAEEGMTFGEWLSSSYNTANVQYSYEHETYGTLSCSVREDTVLIDGMTIEWNI